jgi:c-di-GMP-binding flagellar brake protein YcgR
VVHIVDPDGREVPVGRFRLGIGFEAIHESDREALIRAIFRRQREFLRDGQMSRDE